MPANAGLNTGWDVGLNVGSFDRSLTDVKFSIDSIVVKLSERERER